MNKFDKLPALYYLGFYHPKFDYYEDCYSDNYHYNDFSNRILSLKNRDYFTIHYFSNILTKLIEDEDLSIAAVPSHIAFESNSGIRDLASSLVKSKKKYVDAVKCLERVVTVDKYSRMKGCRSEQEHFNSIVLRNRNSIESKNIILMDDILTSGNSTNACKRILLNAGAKAVKIVCLGKTIRDEGIERAHYSIDDNLQQLLFNVGIEADNNASKIENQYNGDFFALSQEINEDDREGAMENGMQEELADIEAYREYQASEYCEYANEAHKALNGDDNLTPENPFIQFL